MARTGRCRIADALCDRLAVRTRNSFAAWPMRQPFDVIADARSRWLASRPRRERVARVRG
jgi:hypothetical protein